MQRTRILVVGGVAAGPAAAAAAVRTDPDAEVVLFEQGVDVSYGACELPYLASGLVRDARDLVRHDASDLERSRGFSVRTLHRAEGIDPAARRLTVRDLASGAVREERYEALVLATGARAANGGVDGLEGPRVCTLRTLDDGTRLSEALRRDPTGHVVVLGGGFTGLETASRLAAAGRRVTLLAPGGPASDHLEPVLAARLDAALLRHGVAVRRERATAIRHDAGGPPLAVRTDRGELVGAGLVVAALGIVPETALGGSAGLRIGGSGAFRVDAGMRTSARGIWACGDCVEVPRLPDARPAWVPLAPVARQGARVAGHNAARRGRQAEERLRSQAVGYCARIAGLEIGSVGWTGASARREGFDADVVVVEHVSASPLHPESAPLHAALVFERPGGRILGAQFLGSSGAVARANVIVAALHGGATVSDLHEFDFAYSPPVAPALDILTIAGRAARKTLRQVRRTAP